MNSKQNNSSSSSSSSSNISNRNVAVGENLQHMIDNSTAMHYSNQMTIAQSMAQRPKNTMKAYAAKQAEWKVCIFEKDYLNIIKTN